MTAYPLSFAAGLLTSLSPCVLPALPFFLGSATQRSRHAPLAVAAGLVTSFVIVGLLLGMAGEALNLSTDVVRSMSACLMILAGILLGWTKAQEKLSVWMTPLANWANRKSTEAENGSGLKGYFGSGVLLGAVWSPCVGPTLAAATGLATQAGTAVGAGFMMLFFGIGASVPLLFAAYASQKAFSRSRDKLMSAGSSGKKILAAVFLLVGIGVLFGWDRQLEARMLDWLPDWWIDLTTRL